MSSRPQARVDMGSCGAVLDNVSGGSAGSGGFAGSAGKFGSLDFVSRRSTNEVFARKVMPNSLECGPKRTHRRPEANQEDSSLSKKNPKGHPQGAWLPARVDIGSGAAVPETVSCGSARSERSDGLRGQALAA